MRLVALLAIGLIGLTAFGIVGQPASADPFGNLSCLLNEASANGVMVLDSLVWQNIQWPGDFMLHLHNAVFVYGMGLVTQAPGCLGV